MKITEQIGHQGDTQWFALEEIPTDAKKIEKQFIAASEQSGSFHALFGNYEMYEIADGFVIDAKEDCILNHSLQTDLENSGAKLEESQILPKKDHRHSVIKKGLYVVGIQNRFDPLLNMKWEVLD